MEVKSNGIIILGVNYCDAFGKVDDETVFSEKGFPCPIVSNTLSWDIFFSDNLPFLGGYSANGTVRIRNFEWLEVMQTTGTNGLNIEKHKGKLMHR